ncbi:hypothetical protein BJ742DRAFT_767715 [Cladochytrium replicatum]|nr:hypothetical protein BJ742DRAFT_767715 [Cladochytrium replicatum]
MRTKTFAAVVIFSVTLLGVSRPVECYPILFSETIEYRTVGMLPHNELDHGRSEDGKMNERRDVGSGDEIVAVEVETPTDTPEFVPPAATRTYEALEASTPADR